MEVLEAIKSVKSVSKYKPDPVPEQKVQAVVNAARFAVSADNIQPWKFIVVSDEDAKRKLAGACTNGRHMADAPLVADAHVVGLTPLGIPEAYEAPAGRKQLSEILAYNAYD